MSPAIKVPPIGAICAVWWDDPAMDMDIWDPADGKQIVVCPKLTVGVLVQRSKSFVVLSHEAWLDGTAQQWVRTIILRKLITRIESIPGVIVATKPT